jgi:hypothetical protein
MTHLPKPSTPSAWSRMVLYEGSSRCAAITRNRRDEPVRHKRHFSENDANALLEAIGECRRACVTALTKAEIGGPVYRGATRLTSEINIMAEVLTGNRNHFQLRPCGPFGGVPKKPPPPPLTGSN